MTDPWRPVDPLGEALHFLRMSGVFYCRSEFTAPWGLALPAFKACMMFHVVTAGQCWLEVEGANTRLLRPGDLALVSHGEGHQLVSEEGVPAAGLFDLPRESVSDRYEVLRHGSGGASTTVICGVVRFDHPAAHHLAVEVDAAARDAHAVARLPAGQGMPARVLEDTWFHRMRLHGECVIGPRQPRS